MRARAWILAALLALGPAAAAAQDGLSMGQVRSPVLTIELDRLLAETAFGRRIAADVEAQAGALREENARLFETLRAEELALAERRPSMEVEAFRAEAEAFDARAQRIRSEQDAKQRALDAAVAEGREGFLEAVQPVLAGLMIDSGAAVILERRDVFLGAGIVDITDEAVAAIDAELGDGSPAEAPAEEAPAEEAVPAPPEEPVPPAEVPAPPEEEPSVGPALEGTSGDAGGQGGGG